MELLLSFTNEQLKELCEAQNTLNIKYSGENWKEDISSNSIKKAILTEYAEYLESAPRFGDDTDVFKGVRGWKWWKPTLENDEQNMVIETIDVLHFGLSLLLKNGSIEEILELNTSNNMEVGSLDLEIVEETIKNKSLSTLSQCLFDIENTDILEYQFRALNAMLVMLAYHSNRNLDQIYDGYYKKNKLNSERIDNGYREGSYTKVDESGQEDNRKLDV